MVGFEEIVRIFWVVFSIALFFLSFLANVSLMGHILLSFIVATVWMGIVFIVAKRIHLFCKKSPILNNYIFPLCVALLQVLFEWIKDRFYSGLPWLDIYSFFGFIPQFGFITKYIGYYGLTFMVTYLVVFGLVNRKRKWCLFLCFIFILIWGVFGFLWVRYKKDSMLFPKNNFRICIFQTNVSHMDKIEPMVWDDIWQMYLSTLRNVGGEVDLLVIPETMAMYHWPSPYLIELLNGVRRRMGYRWIICGANCHQGDNVYNGAILFGDKVSVYYKRKLVPFGEFIPAFFTKTFGEFLNRWFGVLNFGGYSRGRKPTVFEVDGIRILPLICYEDSFEYLIKDAIAKVGKINVIVVLSNDDWFGMGWAQWFHLSLGRLAAMRFGVWVVKANNDSFSCVISPWGQILFPEFKGQNVRGRRLICGII